MRNLASRSAEEAKQIRKLINHNVESIKEGENPVTSTGETLKTIAEWAQHTAALVSEISAATSEQSAGIEQINQALTQLEEVTQKNAALLEQVATASRSRDDQAGDMADMVSLFKVTRKWFARISASGLLGFVREVSSQATVYADCARYHSQSQWC